VFNKVEDKEERDLIKTMLGDLFDSMQECEDYIKTIKLNNPWLQSQGGV
jgi:hypothetical protein